jgi:molecular chaperone GrpE
MVRIPISDNEETEEVLDEAVETEEAAPSREEELETELAQAKAALVQLAADFENYKRQAVRRETEARDRAVRRVVEDLLPVLDNFQRAVEAGRASSDVESLRIGVEFILQMFEEALRNQGVTPIEAVGQTFDPLHHEALAEVESDQPSGTVVEEAQRGYSYKGHVLRASRVKVAA